MIVHVSVCWKLANIMRNCLFLQVVLLYDGEFNYKTKISE